MKHTITSLLQLKWGYWLTVPLNLLANIMTECSHCFWKCGTNSGTRLIACLKLCADYITLTHKAVGKLWEISCYYACYCWWSLKKWGTVTAVHTASSIVLFLLVLSLYVFLVPISLVLILGFLFDLGKVFAWSQFSWLWVEISCTHESF